MGGGLGFPFILSKIVGGCHRRTKFPIFRSKKVHGPGLVSINFKSSRMTGIFLRGNAFQVRHYAELKVTFPGTPREISMVKEVEKFSTNRACYTMEDIPPKYYGLTHLWGPNDETITFDVNIPVIVYVAIDSRLHACIATPFYLRRSLQLERRLYMVGVMHALTFLYTSRSIRVGKLLSSH